MVTAYYPEVATRFAMPIGRANQIENLTLSAWARFADDMGLGGAFVRRRVVSITRSIAADAKQVADELGGEGCDSDVLVALAALVNERATRLEAALYPT